MAHDYTTLESGALTLDHSARPIIKYVNLVFFTDSRCDMRGSGDLGGGGRGQHRGLGG